MSVSTERNLIRMAAFTGNKLEDRLERANAAKQALLERFKKRPAEDDPAMIAMREERKRVAEARAIRDQARAVREQEREKAKAEAAALKAIEDAERVEAEKLAKEEAARRVIELAAEQKAARDARYAARKARK